MDEELFVKPQSKPMIERRQASLEHSIWWEKFSASSLGKFGYELAFVRHEQGRNIAVLTCASDVAVITEDGEINTAPDIRIRD